MIRQRIREKIKDIQESFSFSPAERIAVVTFFLVFFLFHFYGYLHRERGEIKLVPLEGAEEYHYRVDLNSAPWYELSLLPRVGDAIARRILEYREKKGGFKCIEDLLEIKGIGEKTLEELRPFVFIGGDEDERRLRREGSQATGESGS